jgi:hypothetical protein
VLVAMGVGALLAVLIGVTLLAIAPTVRSGYGGEQPARGIVLAATAEVSSIASSAVLAAPPSAAPMSAAPSAVPSASARAPRAKPAARSTPKPVSPVDKMCREHPERCPW